MKRLIISEIDGFELGIICFVISCITFICYLNWFVVLGVVIFVLCYEFWIVISDLIYRFYDTMNSKRANDCYLCNRSKCRFIVHFNENVIGQMKFIRYKKLKLTSLFTILTYWFWYSFSKDFFINLSNVSFDSILLTWWSILVYARPPTLVGSQGGPLLSNQAVISATDTVTLNARSLHSAFVKN